MWISNRSVAAVAAFTVTALLTACGDSGSDPIDAAVPDAPYVVYEDASYSGEGCNPEGQLGCEAGEKCSFVITSADPLTGLTVCLPDGDKEMGAHCTYQQDGTSDHYYDDCAERLWCLPGDGGLEGTCWTMCSQAVGCDGGACSVVPGLHSDIGTGSHGVCPGG